MICALVKKEVINDHINLISSLFKINWQIRKKNSKQITIILFTHTHK